MARSLQNPIKQVPYMGLGLVCRISLLVMAGYIGMYVKMEPIFVLTRYAMNIAGKIMVRINPNRV
jgi:hypothetical protein